MGSAGRRRPGRRNRPPGEPIRRPPFGAPRRHWWENEGAQKWWLRESAQLRLLEEPAQDLRKKPAQRKWLDVATLHPWYTAIGVGATFLVLAISVIFVLPKHAPSAMTTVPLPAPSVPIAVPSASPRMTSSPSPPAPSRASPSPTASALPATMPSVMATVAPQRAVTVTVVYTLIEVWSGGVEGEFTVTNVGSNYVAGWELSAEFPGDQIQFTWGSIDPNPGSDTIMMGPQPDRPTIAPGTSQSGYFVAQGATIYPSTCTFDGASCI